MLADLDRRKKKYKMKNEKNQKQTENVKKVRVIFH